MAKYKCNVEGCNFETDNRHSIAGHTKGHVHRGELVKGSRKAKPPERHVSRGELGRGRRKAKPLELQQTPPTPAEHPVLTKRQWKLLQQQTPPTPIEIAAALLNAAVDAINKEQSLQQQVTVAKQRITTLTEELGKAEEDRDRVTRIHNEQVLAAKKHGTDLPSTEALMEAAKLR